MRRSAILGLVFLAFGANANAVRAQAQEEAIINSSSEVLREIMAIPLKGIPQSLLANAQGVAIVPGMLKGGFIVAAEHGKGVLLVRDKNGAWQSPNFITITGGGIGWQAGVQATDVVLVFRSQRSVESLLKGQFKLGADASVAAGPVGRQVGAGTDVQLNSEIYSYSRSRGLFAGVSLDGALIKIDGAANQAFYAPRPGQPAYPQSALNLIAQVASYANPQAVALPNQRDAVRHQLADASQRLQQIVDPQWQQYLVMPTDVYEGTQLPSAEKLTPVRDRFQLIATDPRYRGLADRHEFQETFAMLNRYIALSATATPAGLQLPPPPK